MWKPRAPRPRGGGVVEAVNFNSPGQVVIAGDREAVLRAIEVAKARGAKRAVELPVSVPVAQQPDEAAGVRLGERLAATEIRAPQIRYLSAVDARSTHSDPDDIRALLVRQLSSPVRWTATVAALTRRGHQHSRRVRPGRVLAGLVKRIDAGRRDADLRARRLPTTFRPPASARGLTA